MVVFLLIKLVLGWVVRGVGRRRRAIQWKNSFLENLTMSINCHYSAIDYINVFLENLRMTIDCHYSAIDCISVFLEKLRDENQLSL